MTNLSILNHSIRQFDGLYSLNDLHKASGGAAKHQPNRFLRLATTKELINEIGHYPDMGSEKDNTLSPNPSLALNIQNGGNSRGTYVCKQLVLAYGMWVSPKLNLAVINAFLEQQQRPSPQEPDEPKGFTQQPSNLGEVLGAGFTVSATEHLALQSKYIALLEQQKCEKEAQQHKPKRKKPRKLTFEEITQMHQLAEQGYGVNDIARKIDRSAATVSFTLRGGYRVGSGVNIQIHNRNQRSASCK